MLSRLTSFLIANELKHEFLIGGGQRNLLLQQQREGAACPSKLSSVAKGGECRLGIRLDRL